MEKKEKLNIAVRLLKEEASYYKSCYSCVKFDVTKKEDTVFVFPKGKDETSFFWVDEVYEIVKGLGLSCYITTDGMFRKIEARIY